METTHLQSSMPLLLFSITKRKERNESQVTTKTSLEPVFLFQIIAGKFRLLVTLRPEKTWLDKLENGTLTGTIASVSIFFLMLVLLRRTTFLDSSLDCNVWCSFCSLSYSRLCYTDGAFSFYDVIIVPKKVSARCLCLQRRSVHLFFLDLKSLVFSSRCYY